jgi:hypothetical protein
MEKEKENERRRDRGGETGSAALCHNHFTSSANPIRLKERSENEGTKEKRKRVGGPTTSFSPV